MIGHYSYLSRILDIPCRVCGDFSSGKHYNIFACDGCAGFFKRSIRSNRQYICRAVLRNNCVIDKTRRNQCRACRLKKCLEVGMNRDAVQHERGSRKTTVATSEHTHNFTEATSIHHHQPNNTILNGSSYSQLPMDLNNGTRTVKYIWENTLPLIGILSPAALSASVANTIDLCEKAAQLLFVNVQWVKSLSAFTSLPFSDQLLLVEESWKELFILGASHFLSLKELSAWLHSCRELELKEYHKLKGFYSILMNVKQYHLDQHEFTYLRLMMLFRPLVRSKYESSLIEVKVLDDVVNVESIRDHVQSKLNKYIDNVKPDQPLRFRRLLQLLLSFHCVLDDTIEDLFFKKTIGNVPMTKIISDMYRTHSGTKNL